MSIFRPPPITTSKKECDCGSGLKPQVAYDGMAWLILYCRACKKEVEKKHNICIQRR